MTYDPSAPRPQKRFSQVFLNDDAMLSTIAGHAMKTSAKNLLEIGPGAGYLTAHLIKGGRQVLAIEKDPRFVGHLEQNMDDPNLTVLEKDILEFDLAGWVESLKPEKPCVIGNIPYQISTPIVKWILPSLERVVGGFFLVQKEFGERLASAKDCKSYGSLSIYTQLRATTKVLEQVPKEMFYPVPKVDSVLISLVYRDEYMHDERLLKLTETFAKAAFSQRRKKLSNNLKALFSQYNFDTKNAPFDLNLRPENLAPEDFYQLAKTVCEAQDVEK